MYSNRGFAGETAGSSPGDAPGAHSPVRTRVLLVADEGGQPDGEPSTPNATASTRRGFVPVAEGAPGSVAGHENPASGSLGNGASSLSEALLGSHEGSRSDERVFRVEKRVASPTGAPAASDDETDARRHRQQNTHIAGSIHTETGSVREGGGGGAFPRVDSGLFRDPASLAGLRGARGVLVPPRARGVQNARGGRDAGPRPADPSERRVAKRGVTIPGGGGEDARVRDDLQRRSLRRADRARNEPLAVRVAAREEAALRAGSRPRLERRERRERRDVEKKRLGRRRRRDGDATRRSTR